MRVLITGGAGYIGHSLIRRLLNSGENVHSISIYDNLSRKNYSVFTGARFDQKPVKFYHEDILDSRKLRSVVAEHDCIIHLAAKVTTPYADSEAHSYDQVNHWGTAQLAFAVEEHPVKHLIYLSSMSVYGNHEKPVNEEARLLAHSYYGISKMQGEQQIQRLKDKMPVTILRSGNVYGFNPSFRIDAVINRFLFEANYTGKIRVNGSGEQYRAFIHVDKLAHIIHEVLVRGITGTYNVVEHNLTIAYIVDEIKKLYSQLDVILSNHNMPMHSIRAALPCKLESVFPFPKENFEEELRLFKENFSF